ncbi:MAG: hypothetical protein H0V97_11105 [Actinobacteria bacterium]|nr:hypothetical protein [Actinomycetota bacterium]
MVETISPAVHGGRKPAYWMSVLLHTIGAVAAAAAVGFALGSVGHFLGAPWSGAGVAFIALVAALYALRAAAGLPVPIPSRRRQVPDWWRTFFSPQVSSLLYGLGLGVGYLTFLSFGTYVAVAAAALLGGDPFLGAFLCAPFGAGRALTVLLASGARDAEAAAAAVDHIEAFGATRGPGLVNAVALMVLTGACLAAL